MELNTAKHYMRNETLDAAVLSGRKVMEKMSVVELLMSGHMREMRDL